MKNLDQLTQAGSRLHHRRRRHRRNFFETLHNDSGTVPVVNVAQRLREIRNQNNLTIRDLAKKSGLNVNTLSMIENGKNSPSLETLQLLSFVLDTPITAFFENDELPRKIVHYKAGQRPSVIFDHGRLEDLADGLPRRGLETFLITHNPHSDSGETPIVHTGREVVYCLEGSLHYRVNQQEYNLEPGDSLVFEAHLPHAWCNPNATPTRSLLVLCPYDDQDEPTEQHFSLENSSLEI
jgi:transcriptional regulator with XRE-family HTH domain